MKIMLQDTGTDFFLKKAGTWVPTAEEAMVFSDVLTALEFCRQHQLADLRVVARWEGESAQSGDAPSQAAAN